MGRTVNMLRALILPVLVGVAVGLYGGVEGKSSAKKNDGPVVNTKVGRIRGLTASDGEYSMFLGIPYATVNNSNPFGPSIPHGGFKGTFNAYDDSAMCPQRDELNKTLVGSLDCLQLNVYVPKTASSRNRLPVFVWIHGGGFNTAFGGRLTHGPKFLVRHDVIIVNINYRLGAYGFFCLDIPEVPGNQGLKDQLTALRWIKNNIEAFGGDSEKITIAGESSGAISVDVHLIYTKDNLFKNVIIQSSTALSPSAVIPSNPDAPLKLAAHFGHATDNLGDALEFLKTVDTHRIIEATPQLGLSLRPCVEKEFGNVERLISGHPTQVERPNVRSVSILIGFNNNENNFGYNKNDEIVDPFSSLLGMYLDYDSAHLADVASNVRRFYIGDEPVSEKLRDPIANFRSDFAFLHPSYRSMGKYFENGASSIHHYMFSYDGGRNLLKRRLNITASGAIHADELGYLFDVAMFDETPTPEDQLTIDRITTMWTNFAKYSDPTPEKTEVLPVHWPTVTNEAMYCMNIDSKLSVLKRPFHERMAFWDLFYKLDEVYSQAEY